MRSEAQRSPLASALAFTLATAGCGQGESTEAKLSDASGQASPDGSSNADAAPTDAANADALDAGGGSGRVPCAVEAGACDPRQVCLDSIFINGLQRQPDSGPAPPPIESYSCVADPCGGVPDASCYCDLCHGGGQCQVTNAQVSCTTESVCASGDTLIATAEGDRPIASLRPGDRVYSVDHDALRLVPLLRVSRTAVFHHHVVELLLSNGSVLRMSAGHPTADGRSIGNMRPGDSLDRTLVVARREIQYEEEYTYDILPASDTRSYVAEGILVSTTLGP
jgi:hypothetical protein